MLDNLFSLFDPSMSLFSISWGVCFLLLLLLPGFYWAGDSILLFVSLLAGGLKSESDYVISSPSKGVYLFIISVFKVILMLNFLAIFPFIFSMTSHLVVTMPLATSYWLAVVIFGWVKSLEHFLAHLIPSGTPMGLLSFMVLVEVLSNLIRPLALMFRLTANMMAGHLLMSLIGGALISSSFFMTMVGSLGQSLLVFMELGVSIIQAYVFSVLLLLYLSESDS